MGNVDVSAETTSTDLALSSSAMVSMQLNPKATTIKNLSQSIPLNDYGLPEYLYRADLIDPTLNNNDNTLQDIAIMHLDYSQGFAALPNGEAIWLPLPYEDPKSYGAFQAFLDMPRASNSDAPVRQLNLLKPLTGCSSMELLSMSYMYYWPQRVRAYDLFMIASHTKAKELRTSGLENTHYNKAEKFIAFAEEYLEGVFADPETAGLSAKEAFDIMHKMMLMQRLSVGLSPNGAHAGKDINAVPQNASIEVIMQTVAKNAGDKKDDKSASNLTQLLYQNPEMLEQAQRIVIQVGDIKKPRSQQQSNFMDEKEENT